MVDEWVIEDRYRSSGAARKGNRLRLIQADISIFQKFQDDLRENRIPITASFLDEDAIADSKAHCQETAGKV